MDLFLEGELLLGKGQLDRGQETQVRRGPRFGPGVTDIVPQEKHLELLARAMLLLLDLVTGADQIAHRFILRIGAGAACTHSASREAHWVKAAPCHGDRS